MKKNWLWLLVNILAAVLFFAFIAQMISIGTLNGIAKQMTAEVGEWAGRWLILSLAVTPLLTVTRFKRLVTIRKSTGLWAFAYALLHLFSYSGRFDLNLQDALFDIFNHFEYWLGFVALVIMLPLALTSTNRAIKWLKKDWKRLHKGVYAVAVLVGLHVALVKEDYLVLIILLALLVARVPTLRQRLSKLKR